MTVVLPEMTACSYGARSLNLYVLFVVYGSKDHSQEVFCQQAGGLPPLLELMASRNGNLQHNAAFALYGLADNEDNIAGIVREGGVQCLQDCELLVQVHQTYFYHFICILPISEECVEKKGAHKVYYPSSLFRFVVTIA